MQIIIHGNIRFQLNYVNRSFFDKNTFVKNSVLNEIVLSYIIMKMQGNSKIQLKRKQT